MLRGSYNTPGEAYGVFVSGDLAYVADAGSGLQIIDVSNPPSPTFRGSYDTRAYGVFVSGSLAYLTKKDGGLQILDVSDPSSPQWRGSYYTDGVVLGVFVSDSLAYVADEYTGLWILRYSGTLPLGATWDVWRKYR